MRFLPICAVFHRKRLTGSKILGITISSRNGDMVRRIGNHARDDSVAGLSKLARSAAIAVVVKQELNIIPLRQGK
jgi:hypothetical protein